MDSLTPFLFIKNMFVKTKILVFSRFNCLSTRDNALVFQIPQPASYYPLHRHIQQNKVPKVSGFLNQVSHFLSQNRLTNKKAVRSLAWALDFLYWFPVYSHWLYPLNGHTANKLAQKTRNKVGYIGPFPINVTLKGKILVIADRTSRL